MRKLKLYSVETIVTYVKQYEHIFQVKQTQFREMFRAMAPFSYKAVNPYSSLEKVGF